MSKIILLDARETALLVIDVQRALFTRPTPVYKAHSLIDTINALITRANLYRLPVVFIQHANKSFLVEGTDGWNLHPGIKPRSSDRIIKKTSGNAFQGTSLPGLLEAKNIRNVLITGLVTQGCVRATSLGAIKLGYQVFVVQGAHSNYSTNPEQVIQEREAELAEAGAQIVTPQQFDFV